MRPTQVIVALLVVAVLVVSCLFLTGVFDPPRELRIGDEFAVPSAEERIAATRDHMSRDQGVGPAEVERRYEADVEASVYGFDVRDVLPEQPSDEQIVLIRQAIADCQSLVEGVADWEFKTDPMIEYVGRRDLVLRIRDDAIEHSHAFDSSTLVQGFGGNGEEASAAWMRGGHAMNYAAVEACTRVFFFDVYEAVLLVAPGNIEAILSELEIPEQKRAAMIRSVFAHAMAIVILNQYFDLSHRIRQHPTMEGARAFYSVIHGYGAIVQDRVRNELGLTLGESELAK